MTAGLSSERLVYRRSPRRTAPSETVRPDCPIAQECGLCPSVNQDYRRALEAKHQLQLRSLLANSVFATARIQPPTSSPKPLGYRCLFKLAVRNGRDGKPELGLFQPGTHKLQNIDPCPLHTPALRRLLADLQCELWESSLTAYDESTGDGVLRYIVARSAHRTGQIQITFVATQPIRVELKRMITRLKMRGHKLNSCWLNVNRSRGNEIFGEELVHLSGQVGLRERICELDFNIGPRSFFQINPWMAEAMYRRIQEIAGSASSQATAVDLYSGVGQISLALADRGFRVFGLEENREAVEIATQNSAANHLSDRIELLSARVEDHSSLEIPDWARCPDLVIVNPSRRGLAPAAPRVR